jgi:chemotaxis protein MotB
MSPNGKSLQPIIIKRIKKGGKKHHGGAWKIAYADFVTAMMAFFLLMWLLGSTSKGDLRALEAYFNTPMKLSLLGGAGSGSSSSILPGGGPRLDRTAETIGPSSDSVEQPKTENAAPQATVAREEARRLVQLKIKISALLKQRPGLAEHIGQIRMEITADGLRIQIVDDQKRPMFDIGKSEVKPYMREILREIGSAIKDAENPISLTGHTDSTPYGMGERGYSNWELSSDRANSSRRELVAGGMPEGKIKRVAGMASTDPLLPTDTVDPINRRISIVVMTREAAARLLGTGSSTDSMKDKGSS